MKWIKTDPRKDGKSKRTEVAQNKESCQSYPLHTPRQTLPDADNFTELSTENKEIFLIIIIKQTLYQQKTAKLVQKKENYPLMRINAKNHKIVTIRIQ